MKQELIDAISQNGVGTFVENPRNVLIGQYKGYYMVIYKINGSIYEIDINASRDARALNDMLAFLYEQIGSDRKVKECVYENCKIIITFKKKRDLADQIIGLLEKIVTYLEKNNLYTGCAYCGKGNMIRAYSLKKNVQFLCPGCYERSYEFIFNKKRKTTKVDKNLLDMNHNLAKRDKKKDLSSSTKVAAGSVDIPINQSKIVSSNNESKKLSREDKKNRKREELAKLEYEKQQEKQQEKKHKRGRKKDFDDDSLFGIQQQSVNPSNGYRNSSIDDTMDILQGIQDESTTKRRGRKRVSADEIIAMPINDEVDSKKRRGRKKASIDDNISSSIGDEFENKSRRGRKKASIDDNISSSIGDEFENKGRRGRKKASIDDNISSSIGDEFENKGRRGRKKASIDEIIIPPIGDEVSKPSRRGRKKKGSYDDELQMMQLEAQRKKEEFDSVVRKKSSKEVDYSFTNSISYDTKKKTRVVDAAPKVVSSEGVFLINSLAALFGSLIGVLVWVLAYEMQSKFNGAEGTLEIAMLAIPAFALTAYSKYSNDHIEMKSLVMSVIIIFACVYFAFNLTFAINIRDISVNMDKHVNLFSALKGVRKYINSYPDNKTIYYRRMIGTFIWTVIVTTMMIAVIRYNSKKLSA